MTSRFAFYFLGDSNATNERTRIAGPITLYSLEQALPGDFNADGTVDIADYTVWRDHIGEAEASGVLNGNGDGGAVDGSDYLLWKANFSQAPIVLATSQVPVPEPTILASSVTTLMVALLTRQLARRRMSRR